MPTLLGLLFGVGALPRWLLAGVKMPPSTLLLPAFAAVTSGSTRLLGYSTTWLVGLVAVVSTMFGIWVYSEALYAMLMVGPHIHTYLSPILVLKFVLSSFPSRVISLEFCRCAGITCLCTGFPALPYLFRAEG